MPFYFGLDLGQTADYTAGLVLDAQGEGEQRTYDARHLEQFPLGTSYPAIVQDVCVLLARPPLQGQCQLVIDHTGVGRPVGDMFKVAKRDYIGVVITGGTSWHRETPRQWHVSKIQLVSIVQKFLQSGRLRIGAKLPHAPTLQKELRDFRVKLTKAANEVYESREGAHDDLVLSLAIALFVGEHPSPWTWVAVGATASQPPAPQSAVLPTSWLINR